MNMKNVMACLALFAVGTAFGAWYDNPTVRAKVERPTAASLDIAWAKRTPPAIYVCEAFFDVNGAMESAVSSPCTVSMDKRGTVIVIQ